MSILDYRTSGESHGQALIAFIEGMPAGVSLEGSMLPQSGSINSVHNIPGQPGDNIFVFINEGDARGRYLRSAYSVGEGWTPDLSLAVGQGFWIQKQQAQDWVRFFSPFAQ